MKWNITECGPVQRVCDNSDSDQTFRLQQEVHKQVNPICSSLFWIHLNSANQTDYESIMRLFQTYSLSTFSDHGVCWTCFCCHAHSESHICSPLYMKDAYFRYQLIVWYKTEAELRGGGVRGWGGGGGGPLPPPPPPHLLLHWDGLRETPPPYSEKAPSYETQYKLN